MSKKQESEFGKGFVYNLILFAKHTEREMYVSKELKKHLRRSSWFNGASDHLSELEIPKQWRKKKIGKLAVELCDLSLEIGHGSRMMEESPQVEKDFERVVDIIKEIGLLIDKELGLKPIKGEWE